MSNSVTEVRRAAFESWMLDKLNIPKDADQFLKDDVLRIESDGFYFSGRIQTAWAAYNAALDSLVIELPADCHLSRDGLDECHQAGDIRDQMLEAIHSAGVKTK